MSLATFRLGNGKTGTIELDAFTRMLNNEIYDTEEMRLERPVGYEYGYEYMGLALSGSSPSEPVWCCIRRTWLNKTVIRIQYKSEVIWDFKWIGWP